MDLTQLTNDVVSRLANVVPSATVESFEEAADKYDRVQRYARIFVFCGGVSRSTNSPVQISAPIEYIESAEVVIIMQSASLSRPDGCHSIDEAIAERMDAWEQEDSGRAFVRGSYSFVRLIEGVWEYKTTYTLNTRARVARKHI